MKIRACKDHQKDPNFCVVARVESLIAKQGLKVLKPQRGREREREKTERGERHRDKWARKRDKRQRQNAERQIDREKGRKCEKRGAKHLS
jgi:hypothetical protein